MKRIPKIPKVVPKIDSDPNPRTRIVLILGTFSETQPWSLLRRYIVFHFVVDVHGKKYYHDCIVSYFTILFKNFSVTVWLYFNLPFA